MGCTIKKFGSMAGIAGPTLIKGSRRYPLLWKGMNDLLDFICTHKGIPQTFQDEEWSLQWSRTIFENNVFESLSIRMYLHELNCVVDGQEILEPHYDTQNCPLEGSSGCLVAYEDVFLHELGWWATVVIITTSRKSISDCIKHTKIIRKAAESLLQSYDNLPQHQHEIVPASFCSQESSTGYEVWSIHMETTVHYSTLIFSVMKMAEIYVDGVPVSLVAEMVLSFFSSNNLLRYHEFFDEFHQDGADFSVQPSAEQFFDFLLLNYRSWNGKGGCVNPESGIFLPRQHGAERVQAYTTKPLLLTSFHKSRHKFVLLVKNINKKYQAGLPLGPAVFKKILNKLVGAIQGVGKLIGQKILHVSVMVGLIQDWRVFESLSPRFESTH